MVVEGSQRPIRAGTPSGVGRAAEQKPTEDRALIAVVVLRERRDETILALGFKGEYIRDRGRLEAVGGVHRKSVAPAGRV